MSDAKHLFMDSLHDHEGVLEIRLSDYSNNTATARFNVVFRRYPAYRNIDESYRLELWRRRGELEDAKDLGWTFIVAESPWVQEFASEPILDVLHPDITHYVIATENDVIEVLSDEQPNVEQVD